MTKAEQARGSADSVLALVTAGRLDRELTAFARYLDEPSGLFAGDAREALSAPLDRDRPRGGAADPFHSTTHRGDARVRTATIGGRVMVHGNRATWWGRGERVR